MGAGAFEGLASLSFESASVPNKTNVKNALVMALSSGSFRNRQIILPQGENASLCRSPFAKGLQLRETKAYWYLGGVHGFSRAAGNHNAALKGS